MNVSACLVTRGDVEMQPIIDSFPDEWEILVWWNGHTLTRLNPQERKVEITVDIPDVSVYGRYAAIEYASHDLIYVQDDDVIVSDQQAIVDAWVAARKRVKEWSEVRMPTLANDNHVVCNMPQEFRHDFYSDHALVGFGAAFHRDAPKRAIDRFMDFHDHMIPLGIRQDVFWSTCDVVFTGLTPRVLVDVPKTDLEYASAPNRMWKQKEHVAERQRMLDLVRRVRTAGGTERTSG